MIHWVNDKLCFLDRPNPALEAMLDANFKRRLGLLQWDVPGGSGMLEKATSFIGNVTSGFANEETVAKRREACFSCPARMTDKAGNSYCSGCRCGRWQLAKLDGTLLPKLKWRSLKCPLGRF